MWPSIEEKNDLIQMIAAIGPQHTATTPCMCLRYDSSRCVWDGSWQSMTKELI